LNENLNPIDPAGELFPAAAAPAPTLHHQSVAVDTYFSREIQTQTDQELCDFLSEMTADLDEMLSSSTQTLGDDFDLAQLAYHANEVEVMGDGELGRGEETDGGFCGADYVGGDDEAEGSADLLGLFRASDEELALSDTELVCDVQS
jgi:hypothetical protein